MSTLNKINIHSERDDLLNDSSKSMLKDRYLLSHETPQDLFKRVACTFGDDDKHSQRIYDYMSQLWFMPATPVLSNGGTNRGMPISCFLNECDDSLDSIANLWNENVWLASRGGGIGSYWGNVRSIGEKISINGKTSGIIPFIKVQDSMSLGLSQGSLRRGASAVYLPMCHPEIEEFIAIRRVNGGDPNRRCLNIHHGVVISDTFMHAVENNQEWKLISPMNKKVVSTVSARDLWIRLLNTRIETGEPYILYIDNVNRNIPLEHKKLNLSVKTSNLCSEITLYTGLDHLNKRRTAVCCLSSLNLEKWDEWNDDKNFIPDVIRFLDNVLENFINKCDNKMKDAAYSAARERSIGLGVMGFHSLLQKKNVPMESVMSRVWNKKIFSHIHEQSEKTSIDLGNERSPAPDAAEVGSKRRFINTTAIAPTASISTIASGASPGIEPYAANVFIHKTLSGSFVIKNKYLEKLLSEKGYNSKEVWSSITENHGSVQHLPFLSDHDKNVFKTAHEIDPLRLISLNSQRTPYITQAQSFNLFLKGNTHKNLLHQIHYQSWKQGVKSMYYLRSTSIQRPDSITSFTQNYLFKEDECFACQ